MLEWVEEVLAPYVANRAPTLPGLLSSPYDGFGCQHDPGAWRRGGVHPARMHRPGTARQRGLQQVLRPKPRPYDPLLHGFIWPLLGQKSSHKKCYRTEILATSARVIWPRAVALPDGFTIPWLPSCTADDFLHHEQTAGK